MVVMWIRFGENENEDEGEKNKGERKFQRTKANEVGPRFATLGVSLIQAVCRLLFCIDPDPLLCSKTFQDP